MISAHQLRISGIIMIVLVGTACILSILMSATTFLTVQSIQASDLLTAKEIRFFAEHPTKEFVQQYEYWFPELLDLELETDIEAVAITESGTLLFSRTELQKANGWTAVEHPPFTVLLSHPDLQNALGKQQKNLSANPVFATLKNAQERKATWAYVSAKQPDVPWHFIGKTNAEYIGVTGTQTTRSVVLQERLGVHVPAIKDEVPIYLESPFFVLSSYEMPQIWSVLQKYLSEDSANISNSIVVGALQNILGNSISWEYDVVPLLKGQSTLEMEYSASGTLLFALKSTASMGNDPHELLKTLHASYGQMFSGDIQERNLTLDDRFYARDIRMSEKPLQAEKAEWNGWTIYKTPKTTVRPILLTAVKGRTFIVSNAEHIEETLKDNADQPYLLLPSASALQQREITMGGYMEEEGMQRLLGAQVTELQQLFQNAVSTAGMKRFLWSIGTYGHAHSIYIEGKEDGESAWQTRQTIVQ